MSIIPIDGNHHPDQMLHGGKACRLSRLACIGVPVPRTVAVSSGCIRSFITGDCDSVKKVLSLVDAKRLLAVRSSSLRSEWGGVPALLNVGMNDVLANELSSRIGPARVARMYCEYIQNYALLVDGIDSGHFDASEFAQREDMNGVERALAQYRDQSGTDFPQDVETQIAKTVRSMDMAWNNETARLLRLVHGAPEDAGWALVVQEMACLSPVGDIPTYSCHVNAVEKRVEIRHRGRKETASADQRNRCVQIPAGTTESLTSWHEMLRRSLADAQEIDFVAENGTFVVLDYRPVERTLSDEIGIIVDLVRDGIIARPEALMRIEPKRLSRLLHPYTRPTGDEKVIARGIEASPGAAVGQIAFTSTKAHELAAKGKKCVLVRIETGPEDIRAMHIAQGVVTGRGGMTSHAAVIARSLGVPCVAGAMELSLDQEGKVLVGRNGIALREGEVITVDGSNGTVAKGALPLVKPGTGAHFNTFLGWADEYRDIDIRANADSLEEALLAMSFGAVGVGLCRTEHMFFAAGRLSAMREMILTTIEKRRAVILNKLLEMQKADFVAFFRNLPDQPLCIRLLDPPLHEFLPGDRQEICELAVELDIPVDQVTERIDELKEFNPMLGLRGVRLGILTPEIYEMQARAIFEALVESGVGREMAEPEIMIPLVSANQEVEIIRELLEKVALDVRNRTGREFSYKLGVMVETPRAALRAGEIAEHASFLSFGTNDLTQLTYGISRDDAARIIDEYIRNGVYPLDPFTTLDREGVGELLGIATERSLARNSEIVLAVCGEHSADPSTIQFCREHGFSYVSCSPYNVPIARLAAAQCAIREHPGAV